MSLGERAVSQVISWVMMDHRSLCDSRTKVYTIPAAMKGLNYPDLIPHVYLKNKLVFPTLLCKRN